MEFLLHYNVVFYGVLTMNIFIFIHFNFVFELMCRWIGFLYYNTYNTIFFLSLFHFNELQVLVVYWVGTRKKSIIYEINFLEKNSQLTVIFESNFFVVRLWWNIRIWWWRDHLKHHSITRIYLHNSYERLPNQILLCETIFVYFIHLAVRFLNRKLKINMILEYTQRTAALNCRN